MASIVPDARAFAIWRRRDSFVGLFFEMRFVVLLLQLGPVGFSIWLVGLRLVWLSRITVGVRVSVRIRVSLIRPSGSKGWGLPDVK